MKTLTTIFFIAFTLPSFADSAQEQLRAIEMDVLMEHYAKLTAQQVQLNFEMRLQEALGKTDLGNRDEIERQLKRAQVQAQVVHTEILNTQHRIERLEQQTDKSEAKSVDSSKKTTSKGLLLLQGRWVGVRQNSADSVYFNVDDRHFGIKTNKEWFQGEFKTFEPTDKDRLWKVDMYISKSNDKQVSGKLVKALIWIAEKELAVAASKPGAEDRPSSLEPHDSISVIEFRRE